MSTGWRAQSPQRDRRASSASATATSTTATTSPPSRFAAFVERACRPLGVEVVGTISHLHGGRWLKEPPLDEQLDRLAAALRRLAPVAEAAGVKLAIENHADYRGHELAGVLDGWAARRVGARLDTGNAYCAIEEPLAAAEALAPYTLATHIKDQIVEAEPGNRGLAPGGLLALRDCVLGDGHVDLPAIVALLASRGPPGPPAGADPRSAGGDDRGAAWPTPGGPWRRTWTEADRGRPGPGVRRGQVNRARATRRRRDRPPIER